MNNGQRPGDPRIGLFFTGTDTGVGKTLVTAGVAWLLRRQGRGVCVSKPVATGAGLVHGRKVSEDTIRLAEAAGGPEDWGQVTPWAFTQPAAPAVAARLERVKLTLPDLAGAARSQGCPGKILLVEGVGGLLCPLTEEETVADLAVLLGLPVVVVARRGLGTLNHTLLTLEVARARGLAVAGVVVNETTPPRSLAEETNVEELRRRIDVPILAVVPYQAEPASAEVPGLDGVDWWRLGHATALASRPAPATPHERGVT
jgi:dethiobiotin synthetase